MSGETDAFVARLNASLTELLQATYLGGIDDDYGYGIAVHPTRGDVYVTGETYSTACPERRRARSPSAAAETTVSSPGSIPRSPASFRRRTWVAPTTTCPPPSRSSRQAARSSWRA